MARTIDTIKNEITEAWMNSETLATAYGYTVGDNFLSTFSKVSIENIICYIMAAAIWTHEKLFDAHSEEVANIIAQMKPHSLRWYVNKVKAFRAGQNLIDGTDGYDDTGLSSEDIEAMQPVKFASASESDATVYIKVATETGGVKAPISADQLAGLRQYISEVKDAGVRVDVINEPASKLRLSIDIYYNPMVLSSAGLHLANGNYPVKDAIKAYIENLPFNGEYRNSALIDALQAVEGVVIPELISVEESYDGENYTTANAKAVPYAGYYVYEDDNVTITYTPYESATD